MKRILIQSFGSVFFIAILAMLPEVSRGSSQVLGWNASGPASDLPPGLTNVVALAAGDSHTLALKADGTVIAWGDDSWAQSDVPLGLSNVMAVAAGSSHSLALKTDGTIVGWGAGLTNLQNWPDFGQSTAPLGLSNVVAIAASGTCSMALRNDGTVSVWGDNSSGQCNVPDGLTNVVAIALGQYNSLGALGDGRLVAWGNTNVYGAQGQSYIPPTLTGVVAVAGGYHHSLALKSNGTVVAMGSYGNGWYGFIPATVPVGVSDVVAISATGDIDLALTRDGRVFAWGRGGLQDTPAEVTNAVAIANGLNTYNLALVGDGLPFLGPPTVSRTVAYGSSTSFRATATGSRPLFYHWAFDNVDIPGATNPVFSLNNVTYAATGNYSVTVSNAFGKTHGSPAALSVAPLLIASQPQDRSTFLGGDATFEASAVAQGPFSYQWQFNGAALPETDSTSLLLTNLQLNQSGQYSVLVSNSLGQVQSRKARLEVGLVAVWGDDGQSQTNPPVGLGDAVAIAAGDAHNLALKSDGTVRVWGDNYAGQTNTPPGLSNVVSIAAGGTRSLALRSDGTVISWGDYGTAGTNIPAGLMSVGAIAAGVTHNLALKQDGTVIAWGDNTYGQIDIPEGLSNVIAVAAGEYHSLALKADGTVIAWGAGLTNSGYGTELGQAMVPRNLTNAVAIAAGYFHSLALTADGQVVAWGNNGYGETSVPAGLANCVAIAAGSSQSLAVQLDGTVIAWGINGYAQTNLPTGLANAVAVASGNVSSLALIGNGAPSVGSLPIATLVASGETAFLSVAALGSLPRTYQWQFNGNNLSGETNAVLELDSIQSPQAGIYSVIISNSFGHIVSSGTHLGVAQLLLIEQPQDQSILLGGSTTFEVTAAGNGVLTYQWRFNGSDLLGATNATLVLTKVQSTQAGSYDVLVSNGAQSIRSVPAVLSVNLVAEWSYYNPPTLLPPDGLTNVVAISQSDTHSLALNADGTVIGWGNNFAGQLDVPAGLTNVIAIAAGGFHSLALKRDGTVVAWGGRGYDFGSTNVPDGLNNVVAIAAGSYQSLALKADGTVAYWGSFYNNGSLVQTNPPPGLTNVVAIACGLDHDLALKANGTVVAWGDNYASQTTVPANLSNVIAVAGGTSHSVALRANGSVQAWGANYQATNIPGTFNLVSAIAANDSSSIALRMNGSLVQTIGAPSLPPGLPGVSAISAGGQYALALIGAGPPVLTGPLPDRTVPYGVTAYIRATANGLPPLQYQWQLNGSDLPGATNALLTLANVTYAQGGSYSLTVSNSLGHTTSRNLVLGVTPLDIVIPPNDQNIFVGGTAVFSVTAAGEGPFSYQWQLNGTPLDGDTNRTLTLNNLQWNQAGSYSVIVSNNTTSITSEPANLSIGVVAAWGDNGSGQTNVPSGLTNVVGIACSPSQSLALNADGTVVEWGSNPGVPVGLTNVVAIAAGNYNYALALKNDGTVTGWGSGSGGIVPAGLSNVVAIAGGGTHALALKADGTVVAWGDNTYGQTNVPVGLANVVAIAAGYQHSLALTADGNIIGWGDNSNGQLNFPSSATNVVAIAAGDWHGLALRADRTMIGWGVNSSAYPSSPVVNVMQMAAGGQHTIELANAGNILSWGDNSFRQLVPPVGLHNVAGIAAGGNHNLALIGYGPPKLASPLVNRTVASGSAVNLSVVAVGAGPLSYQWQFNGTNLDGATNAILKLLSVSLNQTGPYSVIVSNALGHVTSSKMQLDVASLLIAGQPQDISTFPGANVSFVVTAKGTGPLTYQWQFNGEALAQATNSTLVLSNVLFSQAGSYSVLVSNSLTWAQSRDAQLSLGRVVAWGNNSNGQTNVPPGLTNVIALAAGYYHFLALNTDGTVIGWGADDSQQIDVPSDLVDVVAIAAGMSRSVALKADGTVTAWGDSGSARNNVPSDLSGVVAIACGDYHTLALKSDGTIVTWGDDSYGQSSGPTTASNVVAIAAGSYHSIALRADGTVLTWGSYYDYSTGIYRALTTPAGLSSVLDISSCSSAGMAIRSNRTVAAWGDNAFFERGVPSAAFKIVAITGGGFSCAALRNDGAVVAWGDTSYLETKVPIGLKNAAAIAAGYGAFVALIGDGPPMTSTAELSPSLSENGFTLTLPSQSGRVYALEFARSLTNPSWTSLPLMAGNGAVITLTDPNPAGSQRYYRVRRW